jgi:peptidase M15-like protein
VWKELQARNKRKTMSQTISEHFGTEEFEHGTTIPVECMPILKEFAAKVLEPVRTYIGRPMEITSGDRSVETNAGAHGVKNSEHIWTPMRIAADFTFSLTEPAPLTIRAVFDWIRNNPAIPFHQVIYEHGTNGSIIHISMNLDVAVRQAYEGATHNSSPYIAWEVAPYSPGTEIAGQERV